MTATNKKTKISTTFPARMIRICIVILFLGILAVIFSLSQGSFLFQNRLTQSQITPTPKWWGYMSAGRYEISFPPGWLQGETIASYDLSKRESERVPGDELEVRVLVNSSPWWVIPEEENSSKRPVVKAEEIVIDGEKGRLIERYWQYDATQHITSIYFSHKGNRYIIQAYHLADSRYSETFKKILYSFRFL